MRVLGGNSRMVIAHHLLWTLYGWWLPNDPRGSTSHTIKQDHIGQLGRLHFGRKRLQPPSGDIRRFYATARQQLKHPLLAFAPHQFPQVAEAFDQAIRRSGYTCYALAIMPDHVHLVLRKHRDMAEQMVENLQTQTRASLTAVGLRSGDHPLWTRGGWKVFLDTPEDVRRTARYVENNPRPLGLPRQDWPCVTPYDGWPFHRDQQPR